jgi:DNA-directed RNA polymerase subunit RPC12/RpoP
MTTDSIGKMTCAHCGGHIEYPQAASGMDVECPHCRQTVTLVKPAARRRWLWLASLVVIMALMGWGGWFAWSHKAAGLAKAPPSVVPNPPPADLQRMKQLALWDFSIQHKEGSTITHAVARVVNESESIRYGVEIRLELLDAMGRSLGTCRDYIERLEPNQDTYVRALVIKREVAGARLLSISEQ